MKKRLMKKAEGFEDLRLVELDELDEADIKMDRCPACKSSPLERVEGFKRCNQCGSVYKLFDGKGFYVSKS